MKTEARTQARNLYFQTNLSQSQIAKLLDVDRKTVYNWLKEGKWQQQKKLSVHMPSKIAEQYYYMLANMNHEILSREHQPYPLTHEAEQMRKVTLCLRNLKNRQTTNEAMESYTLLLETIQREDPELAEKVNPYVLRQIQARVDVKFADIISDEYIMDPAMDELYDYEIRPADDDDPTFTMPGAGPAEPDTPGGPAVPSGPANPIKPVSYNNPIKTNIPMQQESNITVGSPQASSAPVAAQATSPSALPASSSLSDVAAPEPASVEVPSSAPTAAILEPAVTEIPVSDFNKSLFSVLETHSVPTLPDASIPEAVREEIKTAAGLVGKIISDPFPGLAQLFTAYLVAQLAKDPNEPRIRPVTGEDLLGLQKSVPETPINQEIPATSDKSVLVAA